MKAFSENAVRAVFILLLFSIAPSLVAESLTVALPGLSADEASRLQRGENLILGGEAPHELRLVPRGLEGERIRALTERKRAGLCIESAFLIKDVRLSGKDRLVAYNALAAVRTISGITYFSETRQRTTVLFSDVFRVTQAGSKTALADIVASSVPSQGRLELHIRDVNFGSTWYVLDIDTTGAGFSLSLVNSRPLGLLFVRAFEAEGLRIHFAMVPVDEGILVYGICSADPSKMASKMVDMFSAVEKRLNAIRGWIVERLAATR